MTIKDGGQIVSLRDECAMRAMQAWISIEPSIDGEPIDGSQEHADRIATSAYTMADAMIRAREVTA